jgi:hypothetical protein
MPSLEHNSPEPQHTSAAGKNAQTQGRWALAKAVWQELLLELPERVRPIFTEPPSPRIEDFQDYLELVAVTLAQGDYTNLYVVLRAHRLVEALWQERALRRCGQAKVEGEMRPAARAFFQELLNDGERSPDEISKLAFQYTHRAFCDPSGLAEVSRLVPGFEMQLVEAEAVRRSFETMDVLSKAQALLGAQRDRAINDFQCAVSEADAAEQEREAAEELRRRHSETAKKTASPQQTKQ